MTVSLMASAPSMPHLFFEEKSIEDRTLSLAAGRLVSKSVDHVTIRQPGSKDDVEKEVEPWLATLHQNPNWAPEWVERAKSMYRQWKEGQEITQVGTHIKMWTPVKKAEADTLIAAGVRTVEELASANEQILGRIGIGGRELKNRAIAWLDSASKDGRSAEELNLLRTTTAQQAEQIADLMKKLDAVLAGQGLVKNGPAVDEPPAAPPTEDFLG